ncbi:DUF423 domain-containing protein [Aureivirga sp. CE67]|uniref:DUF423 domain-containing protein n=1 Tax=Aureivirga sp. CE67 TaxID=1788983 RepID=UPI0018C9DE17|nr:DUF423 domain-containing protein [Aureivirga sp. CE67]
MKETIIIIAGILGALAVILGAFGAHALKKVMNADSLQSFEVGVKYQMYHTIVLLVCGFFFQFEDPMETYIVYSFILGIILFSGSIYGLTLSSIKGKKLRFLGPITPLGGLCFVAGWVMVAIYGANLV